MFKRLLLATCLSIAIVAPASADYVDVESKQAGDWLVRTQQDVTLPKKPVRCLVSSVVPAGQASVIVSYALASRPAERVLSQLDTVIVLYNSNWRLGPDNTIPVTIEDITTATFAFQRISDHEMTAEVIYRSELYSLIWRILDSGRVATIRFPDGQTFSVPVGGDALMDAIGSCNDRMEDAEYGTVPTK